MEDEDAIVVWSISHAHLRRCLLELVSFAPLAADVSFLWYRCSVLLRDFSIPSVGPSLLQPSNSFVRDLGIVCRAALWCSFQLFWIEARVAQIRIFMDDVSVASADYPCIFRLTDWRNRAFGNIIARSNMNGRCVLVSPNCLPRISEYYDFIL